MQGCLVEVDAEFVQRGEVYWGVGTMYRGDEDEGEDEDEDLYNQRYTRHAVAGMPRFSCQRGGHEVRLLLVDTTWCSCDACQG